MNLYEHTIIAKQDSTKSQLNTIKNKYSNLTVHLSGKNLGYGAGNNYGLSRVKTQYSLILNPDVILEKNFFNVVNDYFNQQINFHIIGVNYQDNSKWKTSGFFDEFDKRIKLEDQIKTDYNLLKLEEVDWVVGCAMLINLDKFNTRQLFDENFFLYFEDTDFCLRSQAEKYKVISEGLFFISISSRANNLRQSLILGDL